MWWMRPLAIVVTAAVLLRALALVPALLSYAVRRRDMAETHIGWLVRLQARYRSLLARVFARGLYLRNRSTPSGPFFNGAFRWVTLVSLGSRATLAPKLLK